LVGSLIVRQRAEADAAVDYVHHCPHSRTNLVDWTQLGADPHTHVPANRAMGVIYRSQLQSMVTAAADGWLRACAGIVSAALTQAREKARVFFFFFAFGGDLRRVFSAAGLSFFWRGRAAAAAVSPSVPLLCVPSVKDAS
jgi:hypothetical protein